MRFLDWVAAIVLLLQLPIPLFWLIVHPRVEFWRQHMRVGYGVAILTAWGSVTGFLVAFHEYLFASAQAGRWATVAGLALILTDLYILYRVERELGRSRLVGHAELQGSGELAAHGLYGRVRHPRYASMMLAVLGACLIAATPLLWLVAVVWWLLVLFAVSLEERELRARFGAAYVVYSNRVPRFLPFRFRQRE